MRGPVLAAFVLCLSGAIVTTLLIYIVLKPNNSDPDSWRDFAMLSGVTFTAAMSACSTAISAITSGRQLEEQAQLKILDRMLNDQFDSSKIARESSMSFRTALSSLETGVLNRKKFKVAELSMEKASAAVPDELEQMWWDFFQCGTNIYDGCSPGKTTAEKEANKKLWRESAPEFDRLLLEIKNTPAVSKLI